MGLKWSDVFSSARWSASGRLFNVKFRIQNMNIRIPLPIQIVIDDVGWWNGKDGSAIQDPYRTGFIRNHVPADYQAIVDLGRKLNVRPQAAMILGEWERNNSVATLPSASREGAEWNNDRWRGPWLDEASDIVRRNSAFFEITLHGIGHEFWENGRFTRGEWYAKNGILRPTDDVKARLSLFAQLLDDNNLGPFPESFVPPAFSHIFSPKGHSLVPFLKSRGIKYISTPFSLMLNSACVQAHHFGVDQQIITVDRGTDILDWTTYDTKPEGKITGSICGMHWPNLLHEDPERNSQVVNRWVEFLHPYDCSINTLLARNTRQMVTQLVYHECTDIEELPNSIELNFSKIKDLSISHLDTCFVMKIEGPSHMAFSAKRVKIISHCWKEKLGYHELSLRPTQNRGVLAWEF